MKSTLSTGEMNNILSECLHPVRSRCAVEQDGTLTIQFDYLGDEFTIVGIGKDEYRDARALRALGKSLVAEIEVAIKMVISTAPTQHCAN